MIILSLCFRTRSAIFQDECKIVSDPYPQVSIKLRPHSKDTGYDNLDVSALLLVRYLPGYPYKCPKLQITPEKGLSKSDADNLLSLLQNQANANAREGRVMIFNLVEAAQEFLSEIVPVGQSHASVPCSNTDSSSQLFQKDLPTPCNNGYSYKGPMVYGFIDLFSVIGDSWHWGFEMDENRINTSSYSPTLDSSNLGYGIEDKKLDKNTNPLAIQIVNQGQLHSPTVKLDALEEESEDESGSMSSSDSSRSIREELAGNIATKKHETKDFLLEEDIADDDDDDDDDNDDDRESEASESLSYVSGIHDQASHTVEKDLLMVHLLRLACASKGALADALPEITTELYDLGILSDSVRDLATKPSSFFNRTFDHVFGQRMVSSRISQFWKPISDFGGQSTSLPNSCYLNDFEELQPLGHGGFGHVVLCKNKLDGRQYAVKKIRLKDESLPVNDRILREVATLSRLQHQHVVRYYQAWFETGVSGSFGDTTWGSMTPTSSSFSYMGASSIDVNVHENKVESTYLYIQMEYCPSG